MRSKDMINFAFQLKKINQKICQAHLFSIGSLFNEIIRHGLSMMGFLNTIHLLTLLSFNDKIDKSSLELISTTLLFNMVIESYKNV